MEVEHDSPDYQNYRDFKEEKEFYYVTKPKRLTPLSPLLTKERGRRKAAEVRLIRGTCIAKTFQPR
jgi:hypothetical protein